MKNKWLDNYGDDVNPNESQVSLPKGFVGEGYEAINWKSPAWGGQFQMGGTFPGAVGFSYSRTQSPAPSNGKYAKKTLSSAQNGQEMFYYTHGLDWKPKNISQNGSIIKDDNGYWNPDNWGKPVEINSNDITMQGVYEPLLGISDTGHTQLMKPGKDYKFKGKKVLEIPLAQKGKRQEQKGLVNLDNLLNFTNYNTKQPGGWMDKYSK